MVLTNLESRSNLLKKWLILGSSAPFHLIFGIWRIVFGGTMFQQTIGIPMGTNCAPLLEDLFTYSYEVEFVQKLLSNNNKTLAASFNFTLSNTWTGNQRDHWNFFIRFLSRFIILCDWWDPFNKLYDKRDDLEFRIVNFPYICSNIPESPGYGVYVWQLIRYNRACSSYGNFIDRGRILTRKLVDQGYTLEKLKIYFRKFYGRYNDTKEAKKTEKRLDQGEYQKGKDLLKTNRRPPLIHWITSWTWQEM